MKLSISAENPLERLALALGIPPVTLMDTHVSFMRARAIMVGTKLGFFDAVAAGPLTAAAIAARCGTALRSTEKLLGALVGSGYLTFSNAQYGLSSTARKWVTRDSPTSMRDKVLFEFVEWALVEQFEDYVRTGRPLDIHRSISDEQWESYQRAMRALSGLAAPEILRRTPVPKGAARMLDIGGSHGFISVAMCRKHAGLSAVILDLPAAVTHAAPILAKEGMGERVTHRAGDALVDDLGTEAWDIIYVSQLVHHFDERTNRQLAQRIARALRPHGVFVILEMIRPESPNDAGQVGALLDLYFALTSQSGTWSLSEMQAWQRDAGLQVQNAISLRSVPGAAEVIGIKRA